MDARAYLAKINSNRAKIANKLREKQYWLEMAEGTALNMGGDRVQSSSNKHPMETRVIEAVMIDKEIEQLKQEITDIIRTIERLHPKDYTFLHQVYVQGKQLKAICAESGRSYSWATTAHRKALKRLQRILDE